MRKDERQKTKDKKIPLACGKGVLPVAPAGATERCKGVTRHPDTTKPLKSLTEALRAIWIARI